MEKEKTCGSVRYLQVPYRELERLFLQRQEQSISEKRRLYLI